MYGINHHCQAIQALNTSTQYKIILNRKKEAMIGCILKTDISPRPQFQGPHPGLCPV